MTSPIELLDSIGVDSFKNDAERYAAKEAARRLLARIETPFERIWALAFENPVLIAGLQLCQDLGIWAKWTEAACKGEDGKTQTLDSLLGFCNISIEPNLLYRFLNHLAAVNVLEEVGANTWKPTAFSLAIGDDKNKFDNYRDLYGDDFFAFCQKNPGAGGSFIGLMTALRNHKMAWTDVYDTKRLVDGADLTGNNSAPLFVDIGGAHGLDTAHLLARHQDQIAGPGALFVEDLPEVVSTHAMEKLDPRIQRVAYDFFTPQPLKGSRAYFLHAVPHDWPDADCLRIFANIKSAMKPGYSKLLIYEVVLPAQGATSLMTTLDLQLMNCVSGLERTEAHWQKLLAEAGFRIVEIFRHPRAVESVIEAELL
ncbi:O-methyltransferase [Apiospora arundinis]